MAKKKQLPKYAWIVLAIAILIGIMILTSAPEGTLAKFAQPKMKILPVPCNTTVLLFVGDTTPLGNGNLTLINVATSPKTVIVQFTENRQQTIATSGKVGDSATITVVRTYYSTSITNRSAELNIC